jgi:hypothetical protein
VNAELVYMGARDRLEAIDGERMAGVAVHCGEKGHKAFEQNRVALIKLMDDLK